MLVAKIRRTPVSNTLVLKFSRNPQLRSQLRSLLVEPGKRETIVSQVFTQPFDIIHRVMGIRGLKGVKPRIFNNNYRSTYPYRPSEEYKTFRSSLNQKTCHSNSR